MTLSTGSPAPAMPPAVPTSGSTEPLAVVGLLTAAAAAAIGVLVAFSVPVTPAERDAVLVAIGPVTALVVWLWGRRKVFSPATVSTLLAAARRSGR